MDKTTELVRAGHYLDALREVRAGRCSAVPPLRDTLLAELLERTGRADAARRLAERTLAGRGLPPPLEARCRCVIANVLRDRGETDEAIEHLHKAIAVARGARSIEEVCWAELRLVLALAEGPGLESARAFVPTLRKDVSRSGDPLISAALHLFFAQIETKRGLFDTALEHVRIGRSLLNLKSNSWLEATAAIDASCIAFLLSDLAGAVDEASEALKQSTADGHTLLQRAAVANLGHLQLAIGHYHSAEAFLRKALALSPPNGEGWAGSADGLAQVSLGRGDLEEAERFVREGRRWTPTSPEGSWYYGLFSCLTHGRLLLRQGRHREAARLLKEASAAASRQCNPLLSTSLRLLYAEALARTGRHRSAAAIVASVASESDAAPLQTVAEIRRVTALATALEDGGTGRAAFERAAAILAALGNRTARAELLDDYAGTLMRRLRPGVVATRPRLAPLDSLPPPPRRVTVRLDGLTPVVASPTGEGCIATRAAAVVESGAHPEILGREVVALLQQTACVPAAVFTARQPEGPPEILAWWGCSWADARALAVSRRRRGLDLGQWHGRDFSVAVAPPSGMGRLATLLAVEKLARCAQAQERARRDERKRTALWPIEPDAQASEGLFLSEEMNGIVASARKVAPTTVNVLLTGETGTGKEVLARIIHAASPRADRPFVPFNCTAVPRDLVDSQLFGHRRGAFTGAVADHPGVVRAAEGGTLFLDEIGELAPEVQPKLLRFLESAEIQPLGDPRPLRVADVRVVAATNADIDRRVAEGQFRNDLFYRLNVVRFHLPPLRERREEIPPLSEHFLHRAALEFKKGSLRLAEETMEYLVLYGWPGNVRQLANEMRRIAALAEPGAVLMPEHLAPAITAARRTIPASERQLTSSEVVVRLDQPLSAAVEHLERAMLRHALDAGGDRLEDAARLLGLSRKGLYLKRRRLGA